MKIFREDIANILGSIDKAYTAATKGDDSVVLNHITKARSKILEFNNRVELISIPIFSTTLMAFLLGGIIGFLIGKW